MKLSTTTIKGVLLYLKGILGRPRMNFMSNELKIRTIDIIQFGYATELDHHLIIVIPIDYVKHSRTGYEEEKEPQDFQNVNL